MHKTGLLVLIALLCAGCSLGSQVRGSGNVTTEQRTVAAFSAINVLDTGDVVITQGQVEGLTITTDDNIQPLVLSDVRDTTLYLGMQPNVSLNRMPHVTFTVTVKDLTQLTLSGAANVSVRDLRGDNLMVDNSGAGSVSVAGAVAEQHVTLSGVGNYDGAALTSDRATVAVSGVGNAVVAVRQQLDATVSGVGGIAYIGNPQVQRRISGVGTVQQRNP